jgi:hypothetical protein
LAHRIPTLGSSFVGFAKAAPGTIFYVAPNQIEGILAGWVDDLAVPIRRREVTEFAQHDTSVD